MSHPLAAGERPWERYRGYPRVLAGLHLPAHLRGKLDPSDVVQQVLLKPHEKRDQFRGQSEVRGDRVVEQVPGRPLYRQGPAKRYTAIAEVELKRGRAAAVVEAAREWVALFPNDPTRLYEAARDVALAAELPDTGGRRKEYVRLAVDTLRASAANGFTDVEKLDRERAFAVLRPDPEFRRLTDELRRAR